MENKKKYAYWLEPSLVEEMENMLDEANATSKGDFVRQAIRFYIAYLHQQKSIDFISPLLANTIESVENNISEMLFKEAVELGILSNITAFYNDCGKNIIPALRESCSELIAKNNGMLKFEDAYDWQHGDY